MNNGNSNEPTRQAPGPNTAGQSDRHAPLPEKEGAPPTTGAAQTSQDQTPPFVTANDASGMTGFPIVPGYEILEEIGRGGMGVVYKARQLALDRLVALKVVLAGGHADPKQRARFYAEARAVARLRHPHIVQIHDIGEHDGLPYFSLELIEGGSLAQRIARQPQPPKIAAQLLEVLARTVHFAHLQGVIHRDLKPANILLEKSEDRSQRSEVRVQKSEEDARYRDLLTLADLCPKITDFGLAKNLQDEAQTHSNAILGTPSYMPPEQARGDSSHVGPGADQYALGAILYDLLTGRPPFKGTTLLDTLDQVQTREPVPPSQLQTKIPADLETICLKCLQKDPRRRYDSVLDLADDLRRFQDGKAIVARPISDLERSLRWARRNPRLAALLSTVALLLLALAGVSWFFTLQLAREKQAVLHAKTEAEKNATLAVEQATRAAEAKAKADEHARVAEDQASIAIEALGVLISKAQTLLEDAPNSLRPRQELLKVALELFKRVERGYQPGLTDRSMAAAHKRMGDLYLLNNQKEQAFHHYQQGRKLTEALYQADASNDKAMGNHAVFLVTFGDWSRNQDKNFEQARDFYKQGLELQRAALKVTGDAAELTQAEKKLSVAGTLDQLGTLAYNQGDTDEAEAFFREALLLREEVLQTTPSDEVQQKLAQSHYFLGAVFGRRQNPDAALEQYKLAQDYRRQVYVSNRHSVRARDDLATLCARIGEMQFSKKDIEAAQRNFDDNLKLRRELYAVDPANGSAQRRLSQAYYMAAAAAQARGDKMAAKSGFEECVRLRRDYVKAAPNDVTAHTELMVAQARTGNTAEAARIAEQEVRLRAPRNAGAAFQIACCYSLCLDAVPDTENKALYASKALEAIDQARTLGHNNIKMIDFEPDLEPLRQRPEFQWWRNVLPK